MAANDKFRAFFAVDPSEDVVKKVTMIIKELQQQSGLENISWTKPQNLHLTMRFLGNISAADYEKIIVKLAENLQNMKPFILTFPKLVIFPSKHNPVAIALKPEPLSDLIKLNQLVEQSLAGVDIHREDRAFLPHLTLGKIKSHVAPVLPEIILPKIAVEISELKLYRSDPESDGSVYTKVWGRVLT